MEKTNGQRLLAAWESWIGSWVSFPAEPGSQALLLALWAMHTWFAASWPATAYLFITSEGPGCGKTTLMEVLARLCLRPRNRATLRALAVVRDIGETDGQVSYFFDQVEALNATKVTDEQAILLTGYRKGGEHGISVGQRQVSFSTYCAKCFACVGSIAKDLESRCLVAKLGYGVPTRSWTDEALTRDAEGKQMLQAMSVVFDGTTMPLPWTVPTFLSGREKEIGTPIWSVAVALGLDAPTLERVKTGLLAWFAWRAEQGGERKTYRDLIAGEHGGRDEASKAARRRLEVQALRDLSAVMPIADARQTGHIASVRAVELMLEANRSWVRFNGLGLDAVGLSALLAPFGLSPEPVRLVKGSGRQVKGYDGRKVRKALSLLETPPVEQA